MESTKLSICNLFSKMIILKTTKNGKPHGVPMTEYAFGILDDLSIIKRTDTNYVCVNEKRGKLFH